MRALAAASRAKRVDVLLALALAGAGGASGGDSPFVIARPKDGTSDDWPALMGPGGVVATAAAKGQAVIMMPGKAGQPWVCQTPNLQMPTNVTIIGTPETVINQTLNPAGGATAAAFTASATLGAPVGLAADNVVGSRTLNVLAGTYVPNTTQILATAANGVQAERFLVVNATGTAPNITLTLDRPALVQYSAVGSTVEIVTADKTNIRIFGNGMTLSGTGNAFVHFLYASECLVSDLNLNGDTTNLLTGLVFDIGCYNNDAEQIDVVGCHAGISVIGSELTRVTNCVVNQATTNGFDASDSIQCTFTNCAGSSCAKGILFDGSAGNTQGVILAVMQGGSLNGNVIGIAMQGGSNRNRIIGTLCVGNSTSGCQVQASGGSTPSDNTFIGVNCANNPLDGFTVIGSPAQSERNVFVGCQADGNGASGGFNLNVAANTKWIGLSSRYSNALPAAQVNVNVQSGEHKFIGCHIQNGSNGGMAFQANGGRTSVYSTEITLDGSSVPGPPTAFLLSSPAELALADISLNGAGTVEGVSGNSGTTTWIGPNVDMSDKAGIFAYNITTPGAFVSQSFAAGSVAAGPLPITATGTTPVVVSFPKLRFGNRVMVTLEGGAVAAGTTAPTITETPGTGFTLTGAAAGDTGVYAWRVLE